MYVQPLYARKGGKQRARPNAFSCWEECGNAGPKLCGGSIMPKERNSYFFLFTTVEYSPARKRV